MPSQTKIQLSPFEMDLLNNSEWILTKNTIVKKAQRLLEEVQGNILQHVKQPGLNLPQEVIAISPKISKGENYMGLPWLMLDYPRFFQKENLSGGSERTPSEQAGIFAIRTMFWWGNFFSTTLHLSGEYKRRYARAIIRSYQVLCENDFYTCIHEDQWHHHFEKENYRPVKNFAEGDFAAHVHARSFVKLSCQLSFFEWNNAPVLLSEIFKRITSWIG
jgi:hypothetical protein